MRDFLCRLDPNALGELLSVLGYDAWRRKALVPDSRFPWGILTMDGKYPSIRATDQATYLQVRHDATGTATHGLVRTITATLIGAGRPILAATPVHGDSNEQGDFQKAFGDLVRIYGRLFGLVMYDAGAASRANADAVRKAGKHYFFQVADERWTMVQTLELLLADRAPVACDEELISQRERVVRHLSVVPLGKTKKNLTLWKHAKTGLKVCTHIYTDGALTSTSTRYFVTSLEASELAGEQWLELVVLRWGVETVHQILDDAFAEDKRPWITKDAVGALSVMLLRRVAYTVLTLFRSVTLRSEEKREQPFRKIMEWLKDAVKWPNSEDLEGLRPRRFALPPALA
jgi:hypothetical protein